MNTASASSGTIATPTPRRGRAPAAMAVMMSSPQRFSFEIFATMAPRAARRQPTSLAKPAAAALWSGGEGPSGDRRMTTTAPLSAAERTRLMIYAGVLLTLVQFAVPYEGLIGLPVLFFLKNRLHLSAHGVATFNLIASIPLFVGFAFGFLRDTWSPFGRGDRAHLVVFGLATAAAYG